MLKNSADELKNIRCITTAGILTAVYIVLDICSVSIGGFIKINFDFIAIATVGMLFGPIPAVLAAIAGDFIGCILGGQTPIPLLSCVEILRGLLYGSMLYKKSGTRLAVFSLAARVLDSAVLCLVINTAVLMYCGFMSKTSEQLYLRYGKLSTELLFFIPLMIIVMPAVRKIYGKISGSRPQL